MERVVKPEILDTLEFDHPDAIKNRRDILLLNRLMGNYRWIDRALDNHVQEDEKILEIGAGAGDLIRHFHKKDSALRIDGLDLCPAPADWPSDARWWRSDLRHFDHWDQYEIVVGNLILHQFEIEDLERIGQSVLAENGPRVLIISELVRRKTHLSQLKLASVLGINYVTRHDGAASIAAGFLNRELPDWLGLHPDDWHVEIETRWLGQYYMIAQRKQ